MGLKRTTKSIEEKITSLEALELIVADALRKCVDLKEVQPSFVNDSDVIKRLVRLKSCLRDNISSLAVVAKLMKEYSAKKDIITGKVSSTFKENHSVLEYGLETLQATTSQLDGLISKVNKEIKDSPFLSSYLRNFCRGVAIELKESEAMEKSVKLHTESTMVNDIDDIFDQSNHDIADSKIEVSAPSHLRSLISPMLKKKQSCLNSERSSLKLSEVLHKGKIDLFKLEKSEGQLLLKRPARRKILSQLVQESVLTTSRKGPETSRSQLVLPEINPSKRLPISLKVMPSVKSHHISVAEIVSTHRAKRPLSLVPISGAASLARLRSRQLNN